MQSFSLSVVQQASSQELHQRAALPIVYPHSLRGLPPSLEQQLGVQAHLLARSKWRGARVERQGTRGARGIKM